MKMLGEGKALPDIRYVIDKKYQEFGPPTPTPKP
jgi:hypothetical protein